MVFFVVYMYYVVSYLLNNFEGIFLSFLIVEFDNLSWRLLLMIRLYMDANYLVKTMHVLRQGKEKELLLTFVLHQYYCLRIEELMN